MDFMDFSKKTKSFSPYNPYNPCLNQNMIPIILIIHIIRVQIKNIILSSI